MLDLNALADRRAQALNQKQEGWRQAIWGVGFQKLTQNMTDGEVEAFVAYCHNVSHFEKAVAYLEKRCAETNVTPFAIVAQEAGHSGTSPEQWFQKLAP